MKRDSSLDFIKFLLVLLVVFGHCVQYTYIKFGLNFDDSIIFRHIYSFHMPLFMFVSGCLFLHVKKFKFTQKIQLLIIPFFVWSIINYIFYYSNDNFFYYIGRVIYSPDLGLWFLWVLFFIQFSVYNISKRFNDFNLVIMTCVIVSICYMLSFIFKFNGFGLNLYAWQLVFFVIGILFYKNRRYISTLDYKLLMVISTCIYFASMFFWVRDLSDVNVFNSVLFNKFFGMAIKYISALSFIFIVVLNWNRFSKLHSNRFSLFLSRQSLAFYAIQFPIIHSILLFDISNNIYASIFICFAITMIMSSVLIYIINTIKLVRIPLFGR